MAVVVVVMVVYGLHPFVWKPEDNLMCHPLLSVQTVSPTRLDGLTNEP